MPIVGRRQSGAPLDGASYEEVLSRHYDRLYSIAYRILGCAADAEDVVQDVCLSLPEKLDDFRGEASLSTWLYRIATNRSIDALRARKRRQEIAQSWGEVELMRRADAEAACRTSNHLEEAMSRLPESDQATLALLLVEGMSQAQAAEVLEVSPGTVAWRMSRIKARLKDLFEESSHEVSHA